MSTRCPRCNVRIIGQCVGCEWLQRFMGGDTIPELAYDYGQSHAEIEARLRQAIPYWAWQEEEADD